MIADANTNDPSTFALIPEEPEAELRRDLTSTADDTPKSPDPLQLSRIERIYQHTVTEIRLPTEDLSM